MASDDPVPPGAGAAERTVLVVGGTGMLSGLVQRLAAEGRTTAVVGRRRGPLDALARAADPATGGGAILPVRADYTDPARLRTALAETADRVGRFDLAVLWIHTPHLAAACAAVAGALAGHARVVHVLGSAAAAPGRAPAAVPAPLRGITGRYQRVVLGFAGDPGDPGGTRWLTHAEISDGVLAAVHHPRDTSVVGRVRPWSDRPH